MVGSVVIFDNLEGSRLLIVQRAMPTQVRVLPLLAILALVVLPLAGQPATRSPGERVAPPQFDTIQSEQARMFLRAFEAISRYHASNLSDSVLWERALDGLIGQLDDPYATVFTEEEFGRFTESNTGDYAGIGVQIGLLGSRVTVTAVFRDSPAEGVGMMVGDRIVWVEGHDARDWNLDQARDSIRGVPGTTVNIQVARDGVADPVSLAIVRDNVHVNALQATLMENDVAYFAIDRIARGVAEEIVTALADLGDIRALIMDLRRNPGGYLDESLRVTDLFLAPGQRMASVDADGPAGRQRQAWPARSPALIPETPIIILLDEFTASAAEIIAGALQDHDRAVLLGQRSFGKGSVQTTFPLLSGHQMKITTGSWYTPLGRSLHRVRHRDGSLKPEDEELQATVATRSGRQLRSGGGIFPDLEVEDDLLKPEERAFLNHANELMIPVPARIEEYSFDLAKDALRNGGEIQPLPSSAFDDLVQGFIDDGMDAEIVADPVVRAYLDWRTQIRYLYRAEATEAMLVTLAERDPVLTEALRLASAAESPGQLFTLVEQAAVSAAGMS